MTELLRLVHLLLFTLLFWGLGASVRSLFPARAGGNFLETVGLGLASLLLIVFLLGFFNGGLTPSHLWLALGLLALAGLILRRARTRPLAPTQPPDRLFLLLGGILLLTRLLQIRGLFVPNWVDGLNHQLLLQRWDGLATISSDRIYHTGFHMVALALRYLTGWDFPSLMLSYGQWLGVFFGLSFYLFLKELLERSLTAFLAAATASLFLLFPSYLISWGRYPLLQGLALLPFALSFALSYFRHSEPTLLPPLAALTALSLSHYGATLFWFAFVVTHIVQARKTEIVSRLKRLTLLLLPLVLAFLPRLLLLLQRTDLLLALEKEALPSNTGHVLELISAHDWPFLLLAAFGLWLIIVREPRLLLPSAGWGAVALAVTFAQVNLFGSSAFGYENALIFLALPVSLLAGWGLEKIWGWARHPALAWTLALFFLAAGCVRSADIINPDTVLFTSEDRLAFDWVSANLPPDAVILVNSAWWGDRYAPSDGGAWLNPLTGRETVFAESASELEDASGLARRAGVDYVYIGGGYGGLSVAQFLDDPNYELVYRSDDVTIYRVVGEFEN